MCMQCTHLYSLHQYFSLRDEHNSGIKMNSGCAKRLRSIYYVNKSHIHPDTLYKHSLNFNSSTFNSDYRKQPCFPEKNSVHSLIQTVGSGTRARTIYRKVAKAAIFIHALCERAHSILQKS